MPTYHLSSDNIARRCVMMMNEVVRALDDRVIGSAREGGIGAIYGIDFPPFLGGPFCYMERLGIRHVVNTLEHLMQSEGERFTLCPRLCQMAGAQEIFYSARLQGENEHNSAG
ncbi:hypothetical protein LU632_07755 [Erwinia tracheiphila]|uniref:hypothetical protein n=1 Tax=Erwinia tracheiphila TaxID=65700 RepID=UPI001F4922DC|nr:hypothetical protein [Erwinia tracheiphila]UIA93403.1 hypothetical protein LU632_07755 [Erwinia tracheiphila]